MENKRRNNYRYLVLPVVLCIAIFTTGDVMSQETKANMLPLYKEQLISFLNNSKMDSIIYREEPAMACSGLGISIMDLNGDTVPEVIIQKLEPFMSSAMGTATVYDLYSCDALAEFHVGLAADGDSIRCYKDSLGSFRCIVTETLYKMHGRLDTIITEITFQNGKYAIQTKYLFQCTRDYGATDYSQYYVFEDLTKEEETVYRKVPYLEPSKHIPVSVYNYIQYMNDLHPVDSPWEDIGTFLNGEFTASAGYEDIANSLKK